MAPPDPETPDDSAPRPSTPGAGEERAFSLFRPAPEEADSLSPESAASLRALAASFAGKTAAASPGPDASRPALSPEEAGEPTDLAALADRLNAAFPAVPGSEEGEAVDLLVEPEPPAAPPAESAPAEPPSEPEVAPEEPAPPPVAEESPPSKPKRMPPPPARPVAKMIPAVASAEPLPSISPPAPPPVDSEVPPPGSSPSGLEIAAEEASPPSEAEENPPPELSPEPMPEQTEEPPRETALEPAPESAFLPPFPEPSPAASGEPAAVAPEPPPLPAPVPPAPFAPFVETALILAGGLLIFMGLTGVCVAAWSLSMPVLFGGNPETAGASALPRTLGVTAAVAGLTLGWGCLLRRRWAPPLLGAASLAALVASLSVLAGMALSAGVLAFSSSPAGGHAAGFAGSIAAAFVTLALALGAGAFFVFAEREDARLVCESADPRPRWTGSAGSGALLLFVASPPLALFWLFGPGEGLLAAAAGLPLLASLSVLLKAPRVAWGLLAAFTVVLVVSGISRSSSEAFAETIPWTVAPPLFSAAILLLSRTVPSRRS